MMKVPILNRNTGIKMKLRKIVPCLLPTLALVSSCGHGVNVMDRPKGYSLDFWVGDIIASSTLMKERTFGRSERGVSYLDSRYPIRDSSSANPTIPRECVYYWLAICQTDYVVSNIRISDPKIDIYGLNVKSSEWKIKNTLEKCGFKYLDMYSGLGPCYSKDDVEIRFCSTNINVYFMVPQQTDLGAFRN